MMYQFSSGGRGMNQFPGGGLGCLITAVAVAVGGYYLLQGLYYLLLWAAPALLVLALIINWRVFPDTLRTWVNTLKTNPLSAVISLGIAVLAFPFFSFYLFLKALGYRKMEQLRQQYGDPNARRAEQKEEFASYEELESTPKEPTGQSSENKDSPPPIKPEIQVPPKEDNRYDSFFK